MVCTISRGCLNLCVLAYAINEGSMKTCVALKAFSVIVQECYDVTRAMDDVDVMMMMTMRRSC